MKYLFVGGFYNPNEIEYIIKNNSAGIQFAADRLQWNYLRGLYENNVDVEGISKPFLSSYPKRSKISKVQSNTYYVENIKINQIGYCNLFAYKLLREKKIVYKAIINKIKRMRDEVTLIFYSPQSAYLDVIKKIKPKFKNLKIILIVPDLPILTVENKKKDIRYLLRRNAQKKLEKSKKYVDKYVFLTEGMAKWLNVPKEKYVIVEGIIPKQNSDKQYVAKHDDIINILYTGTLSARYGIMNLVDAFERIPNSNYRLIICGSGETEQKIKEYALQDKRIIYKGNLPPSEIYKLQQEASVLVNPRQNEGEYTKYSFPSKMMEYLLSGTPIVCYKLDGFLEEYDEYFYYPQDNDIQSLTNKILEVSNLDDVERERIFYKQIAFVNINKNAKAQVLKIIN